MFIPPFSFIASRNNVACEPDRPNEEEKILDSFNWAWDAKHQAALDALHAGDVGQAIVLAREAVDAAQASSVDDAPMSLDLLATAFMAAGEWSEAIQTLSELLSRGSPVYGRESLIVGAWLVMLGEAHLRHRDSREAEPLLREGLRVFAFSLAADPVINDALDTHEMRVFALSLAVGTDEGVESIRPAHPPEWPTHPAAVRVLFLLATSLNLQEKFQESIRYCNATIALVDRLRSLGWENKNADSCQYQAEKTKQYATQQMQNTTAG